MLMYSLKRKAANNYFLQTGHLPRQGQVLTCQEGSLVGQNKKFQLEIKNREGDLFDICPY